MADDDPLVAFMRARIAEDVAAAKATSPSGRRLAWTDDLIFDENDESVGYAVVSVGDVAGVAEAWSLEPGTAPQVAAHVAHWDPARVLAEAAAKTALLDLHSPSRYEPADPRQRGADGCALMCDEDVDQDREYSDVGEWPCRTVLLLAQPYRFGSDGAQRPDWNDEWTTT